METTLYTSQPLVLVVSHPGFPSPVQQESMGNLSRFSSVGPTMVRPGAVSWLFYSARKSTFVPEFAARFGASVDARNHMCKV